LYALKLSNLARVTASFAGVFGLPLLHVCNFLILCLDDYLAMEVSAALLVEVLFQSLGCMSGSLPYFSSTFAIDGALMMGNHVGDEVLVGIATVWRGAHLLHHLFIRFPECRC